MLATPVWSARTAVTSRPPHPAGTPRCAQTRFRPPVCPVGLGGEWAAGVPGAGPPQLGAWEPGAGSPSPVCTKRIFSLAVIGESGEARPDSSGREATCLAPAGGRLAERAERTHTVSCPFLAGACRGSTETKLCQVIRRRCPDRGRVGHFDYRVWKVPVLLLMFWT